MVYRYLSTPGAHWIVEILDYTKLTNPETGKIWRKVEYNIPLKPYLFRKRSPLVILFHYHRILDLSIRIERIPTSTRAY